MLQLLHIFKKDIRGLWGELAVFLGTLVLACLSFPYGSAREGRFDLEGSWTGETIVLLAGCYLIARLIHSETIPGSHHFWLTRPYRWLPLLGAKILFMFAFVHLPVFVAQAVLLRTADFPVWGNLAALLWTQVMVLACVSLPAAAVAAVTTGLAGFAVFPIGGLALAASLVFLRNYKGLEMEIARGGEFGIFRINLYSFGWVTYAVMVVALAAAALTALVTQYSARQTSLSRVLLGAIFATGLATGLFSGPGLTWTIQTLASTQSANTASLRFSLGTLDWIGAIRQRAVAETWPPPSFEKSEIFVQVPLVMGGVEPAGILGTENVSLSFEAADGETAGADSVQVNVFHENRIERSADTVTIPLTIKLADGKFYEKLRNKPATVRGYIDLFIVGNARSLSVPRTSFPVNLTPAFRCDLKNIRPGKPFSKDLSCRAAFRWPLQWIDVGGASFVKNESFSPFPATLRLNPVLYRYPAFALSESPQVDFTLREPASFVRQEFEIHDVRLIEGPGTRR